jgi:hypothetical protein
VTLAHSSGPIGSLGSKYDWMPNVETPANPARRSS